MKIPLQFRSGSSKGFKPTYLKENSFQRIVVIQIIAAFVIAPVFTLLTLYTAVPEIYFYIGISYTILFPFYALLCWKIPYLRDKLVYFFFLHYFGMTLFAFYSLYSSGFIIRELFCFLAIYALGTVVVVRLYPAVLYHVLVFSLLSYSFITIDTFPLPKLLIIGLFFALGGSSLTVLVARYRLMNDIEDYADYLKKIMNNPGAGYVLIDVDTNLRVLDFNEEACRVFNIKKQTRENIYNVLAHHFTEEDFEQIRRLSIGKKYKKDAHFNKYGLKHFVEMHITVMPLKTGDSFLVRILDVTEGIIKHEELEMSEKKYRNLYYRNKAGVFTINKSSVIINGNQSFFDMFENTVNLGERLFPVENDGDWEMIIESFGEQESSKNYQTQFTLRNGKEKTFIFSWYLDTRSQNIEGSVIDLTSIQKTSQALKQSEEKYRLIFEESNDAILLLDDDKIIDVNRKTIQLFGLPQADIMRKSLYDLSANKNNTTHTEYEANKEKLSNARSVKFNWLFTGNNRIIEAEVALIEIMFGNNLFYQCVIHDNTEQNKSLRAIKKNQRNLENILENTPEGILIVRAKEVLYTNPEIENLVGRDFDFSKLFTSADQKRFDIIYTEHLSEKSIHNLQLTLVNTRHEELLMDVTIVSTSYEEEEASLIIMKDVSVQNTLAKEKLRAELAEESNKKLATEIMERIKTEKLLQDQYLRTKAILDSSSNTFLLTLSLDGEITSYNTHSETYFSTIFQKRLDTGVHFNTYFQDVISKVRLRLFNIHFSEVKKGKSKQFEVMMEAKGMEYWLEIFMNPIFDVEGAVAEISLVAHDSSEKKKNSLEIEESLKEKEVLLKEIHHRVKNNLQVISSILNLQSSFVEDENTLGILQESRNRIRSMAIIHENLYRTEDFSSINFSSYLDNLTSNLVSSYRIDEEVILNTNFKEVDLILDQAIPCGLLVNELVTNALKYAWKEGEAGTITMVLEEKEGVVHLEIADDGVGLPVNFEEMKSDTLGLQLVVTLVEQLDGEINVDIKNGTKYLIKFDNTKPLAHV